MNGAKPLSRKRRLLFRLLGLMLIVLGMLALGTAGGYWGYRTWAVSNLDRFNKEAPLPGFTAPTSGPGGLASLTAVLQANGDDSPPVWIRIPRIGVDSAVDEVGTEWRDAVYRWVVPDYTVGYPKGGTTPGQGGNTVMWGHLSTPVEGKGAVFRRLPELDPGDEVLVDSLRFRYRYRVIRARVVTPDKVDIREQTDTPTLTLITCVPEWVYSHRLIVTAQLIEVLPLGQAGPQS